VISSAMASGCSGTRLLHQRWSEPVSMPRWVRLSEGSGITAHRRLATHDERKCDSLRNQCGDRGDFQ
jgi:hypothetical protein